jgi:hypothetical protein
MRSQAALLRNKAERNAYWKNKGLSLQPKVEDNYGVAALGIVAVWRGIILCLARR